jgi:hypothetical protein
MRFRRPAACRPLAHSSVPVLDQDPCSGPAPPCVSGLPFIPAPASASPPLSPTPPLRPGREQPSLFHARTASSDAVAASGPSSTAAAGAFFKETAAKTKEGFAKIGNFIRVANALAGGNEGGAAGGADGTH